METAKPANVVSLTQQGRPTDPEVKDEAFRLWIELGRSWTRVSERTGIPVRTLHHWGDSEKWEERRLEQAQSFLPGARAETAFALRLAAHNASLRLQQLANEYLELGTKPDSKEVQALTMIVDRGGYSPVGSRNPLDGDNPLTGEAEALPDFATMSVEELRAWREQAKRRRKR